MRVAWEGSSSDLRLGAAELAVRVEQALALLGQKRCAVCPRRCKAGRLLDHAGLCAIGRQEVAHERGLRLAARSVASTWRLHPASGTV
jgi:uncharacterized Fe-S radical SAM superfamily protein PflX